MSDRSFNHCIAVLGIPGTGKSTYAAKRAKELQAKHKCYIIAHDVGWCVPDRIPTDAGRMRKIELTRAHEVRDVAGNLLRKPEAIHTYSGWEFLELVELVQDVAVRNPEHPVILLIDEAVTSEAISANRISPEMKQLLAKRRHYNVGIIWTTQTPQFAHYSMISLSTEIVMFRMNDQRALQRLLQAGVDPAKVNRIPHLQGHDFILEKR